MERNRTIGIEQPKKMQSWVASDAEFPNIPVASEIGAGRSARSRKIRELLNKWFMAAKVKTKILFAIDAEAAVAVHDATPKVSIVGKFIADRFVVLWAGGKAIFGKLGGEPLGRYREACRPTFDLLTILACQSSFPGQDFMGRAKKLFILFNVRDIGDFQFKADTRRRFDRFKTRDTAVSKKETNPIGALCRGLIKYGFIQSMAASIFLSNPARNAKVNQQIIDGTSMDVESFSDFTARPSSKIQIRNLISALSDFVRHFLLAINSHLGVMQDFQNCGHGDVKMGSYLSAALAVNIHRNDLAFFGYDALVN